MGLRCWTGLGNTSQREKKFTSVSCPDDDRYVCLKMFDGGMGDHIRRKCESVSQEEYETLVAQEEAKARAREAGEDLDPDPTCHDAVDHGRRVRICYCTGDQCNGATDDGRRRLLPLLVGVAAAARATTAAAAARVGLD